jgi:protease-4
MEHDNQTQGVHAETGPPWREIASEIRGVVAQMHGYYSRERRWVTLKRWIWVVLAFGFAAFYMQAYGPWLGIRKPATSAHVSVIPVHGEIRAGSDAGAGQLVPRIDAACKDRLVRAVVVSINSPGGSPTEAERIGRAMDRCRANGKPVLAAIEGMGASAAYLLAVHADSISANPYALVGSIGAVMSSMQGHQALDRLGIEPKVYASGPYKTLGSWMTPDTAGQQAVAQSLVDTMANNFAAEVRARRGDKIVVSKDLNTGRVWTAHDALQLGLIDQVAVIDDVIHTRFKGLDVQTDGPRKSMGGLFNLDSAAHALSEAVVAKLTTPTIH